MHKLLNPALLTLIMLGTACNKSEGVSEAKKSEAPKPAATQVAKPAKATPFDADVLYKQKCVVCHGANGKGDGPGSAALTPKPRDFSDVEWQKATTDEALAKIILSGGMAVGKSPIMPGSPELKGNQAALDAMVKKVRSFK